VSREGRRRRSHFVGDSEVVVLSRSVGLDHPWVLEHLRDGQTVVNVAVQHFADQIDAGF
jgi:hypothetical protein